MPSRPSAFVLKAFPRAVLVVVGLVAAFPALATLSGNGDVATALGGDFPSFYAAGEIVLDGHIDHLYDAELQWEYQEPYRGEEGGFLYFAYPPYTAVAYAAFAWMPYGLALTVHAWLALAAVVAAMWVLTPRIDRALDRPAHVVIASAVALAVLPLTVAVLGGQNTAFTLLLVALVWSFDWSGRFVASGVAAGALLYKPQFGLLVIAALIVGRRFRASAAAGLVALALYATTAFAVGWRWPSSWLEQVATFSDQNTSANGHLLVNIGGWFSNLWAGESAATIGAVVMWLVVAATAVVLIHKIRLDWIVFGVATASMVLLSPSSLFYDAAIAIAAFALWAVSNRRPWWVVAGAVALSWSAPLAKQLGWNPLFVLVVVLFVAQAVPLLQLWRPPESVSQAPGTLAAPGGQEQRRDTWRVINSS